MVDLLIKAAGTRQADVTSVMSRCKKKPSIRFIAAVILLTLASGSGIHAHEHKAAPSASDDRRNLGHALGNFAGPKVSKQIAAVADSIRAALGPADGPANLATMNRHFFETLGFVVGEETGAPEDLMPERVLHRRQGACVGLAVVYILLSRELGLPVRAVAAPGHVFARYSDERDTINIELLQRGARLSDQWYIDRYRIPPASIKKGVFLRSLSDAALMGIVHSNLGAHYSRVADFENAGVHYRTAIAMAPNHPGAYYNWGLDLLAQGRARDAVRKFSRAIELYPTDAWALRARAAAHCFAGRRRRAQDDFARALALSPDGARPLAPFPDAVCPPIHPH